MSSGFFTLLGVVLGFGLAEFAQWRKRKESRDKLKRALIAELKSIIRMTPNKEDILSQAHEKLSSGNLMPTSCVHFPRHVYEQVIESEPELLSDKERDCLHAAYERLRIIDSSMDSMEDRFNSITAAHSSLQASQAISSMLDDLKDSLPQTVSMVKSVLENNQPTRKRSTVMLVLTILAFACSFFIRGGSETGVRFFLWRDQPLVALLLVVVAVVLLWFWWRGTATRSA